VGKLGDKIVTTYLDPMFGAANAASKSQAKAPAGFTGGGLGGTSYKTCVHLGNKPEFELTLPSGKVITLAGARSSDVVEAKNTTLIIDLAGAVKTESTPWIKRGPAHFKALELPPDCVKAPVLRLNWTDRAAPEAPHKWWVRLLKVIDQHHAPGHVIVACIGSHGRTGTCIASMLLAGDPKLGVEDVVNLVRDEHCDDSIESAAQMRYLLAFRPDEEVSDELYLEANPKPPSYASTAPVGATQSPNFSMKTDKPTKDGTAYLHISICALTTCKGCNLKFPEASAPAAPAQA
jgi:protein-tyrosine phosphatase